MDFYDEKQEGVLVDYFFNGEWKNNAFVIQTEAFERFDELRTEDGFNELILNVIVDNDRSHELTLNNIAHFIRILDYDGTAEELKEMTPDQTNGLVCVYVVINPILEERFFKKQRVFKLRQLRCEKSFLESKLKDKYDDTLKSIIEKEMKA